MGTKSVIQCRSSTGPVRLITIQLSHTVGYVLEFGDFYMRFIHNGALVLETPFNISAATQASPGVVTVAGNNYVDGDVVFVSGVVGMTQLNNRYFKTVNQVAGTSVQLRHILDNSAVDTTGYTAYGSGGTMQRVETIATPYAAADLALLKFAQDLNKLYICHPNYPPQLLTYISTSNWTITPLVFGSTVSAPTNISVATTLAAGTVNYSYTVTAVDANGQESSAGTAFALASKTDLRTVAGTNRVTWTAVTGAIKYNVYKSELSYTNAVAAGAAHGFIGTATGTTFDDSNIAPDFIERPPISKNPFQGSGVVSVTAGTAGAYTSVPSVTVAAAPAGGVTATAAASLGITSAAVAAGGVGYTVGDLVSFPRGIVLVVATVAAGAVTSYQALTFTGTSLGSITSGATPANPLTATGGSPGSGGAQINVTWGVTSIAVINQGAGYTSVPAVTFSSGAATATAVLAPVAGGNPFVPQFAWQRLGLLGQASNAQQVDFSQPGLYTNFDVSDPAQPDDAISGVLISGQLNEIKSAIPMPSGLIVFSNKAAWLLYGTQAGQAATAIDFTAQSQAYNGANDVPPIIANDNILYIQANGSSVRNLNYNLYANVYTGTDISILSSHLFFNKEITEWCWAEEPFKVAWAIRSDGIMLSLTFVKEQELIGWTQHNTDGLWKSCATVVEDLGSIVVNAVYFVVERVINGVTAKFIERMADRTFTTYTQPWCVDAGLQYSGAPATTFFGLDHLMGETVVGLADGIPFSRPVNLQGTFTLASAASLVTAGLQFIPDFQTLAIDTGNPTIQSKMKKIVAPTLRVQQTLGLQMGQTFDAASLVSIDDLVLGNVGTMTNEVVADLITGDVRMVLDPDWTEQGQFCIRQPLPYPSTLLGVIPELTVGDTEK